jgi:hypothetical protein
MAAGEEQLTEERLTPIEEGAGEDEARGGEVARRDEARGGEARRVIVDRFRGQRRPRGRHQMAGGQAVARGGEARRAGEEASGGEAAREDEEERGGVEVIRGEEERALRELPV